MWPLLVSVSDKGNDIFKQQLTFFDFKNAVYSTTLGSINI